MQIKIIFFLLYSSLSFAHSLHQQTEVCAYATTKESTEILASITNNYGISCEWVSSINPSDDRLYLIADAFMMPEVKTPKNYIIYQSLDLAKKQLSDDYREILKGAVAIWDFSKENIALYSNTIKHFYHVPENYEFIDPIILPCYLPSNSLTAYRDLLAYSNTLDTDISSHLPTIFCYTLLQQPRHIIEAGVRGGESTKALEKVLFLHPGRLIGIDFDNLSASVYSSIQNAHFLCMDDRTFMSFYNASEYKNQLFEVIFIDTSHTYEHTLQEIQLFEKLLAPRGILIFHDSNVTPYNNNTTYYRINGTSGNAVGNTRGVTQAIKEYFALSFDEYRYFDNTFESHHASWHITHYPFCNGLTIIRLLQRN